MLQYLDDQATLLQGPSERNFEKWPILGRYIWPNYYIGQSYQEEVNYLKQWVNARLQWLDENISGECLPISNVAEVKSAKYSIQPNPAIYAFTIRALTDTTTPFDLSITSMDGLVCKKQTGVYPDDHIDISHLTSGVYIVTLLHPDGKIFQEKLMVP